jgi:anaerobic selenocysteine-containing dehydrogenase
MSLSRRDFIKQAAAVSAAGAVSMQIPDPARAQALATEKDWKLDKSVCRFCGTGCGLMIATRNDKIVAVKGGFRSNNIDPNARHCMASAGVGFIQTFGIDEPAGNDDGTLCHAPQANTGELAENTFEPYYRAKKQKQRSNLLDPLNQGVE